MLPTEHHQIYESFGTVHVLGQDWDISDFKAPCKDFLKMKFGFKLSEVKTMRYENMKVGVKSVYNGEYCYPVIGKKGKQISAFKAPMIAHKNV